MTYVASSTTCLVKIDAGADLHAVNNAGDCIISRYMKLQKSAYYDEDRVTSL